MGISEGPWPIAHPQRAWYAALIRDFAIADPKAILGTLTQNGLGVEQAQLGAWLAQIELLQTTLGALPGYLFLEFVIPRMGRRIDAAVLLGPAVLAIEFKVGASTFDAQSIDQVWDYALDLKNFHKGSHNAPVIPILVATEARKTPPILLVPAADGVYQPVLTNTSSFKAAIEAAVGSLSPGHLDGALWASAPYQPTPTIVEAARSLYARHSVEDIARHDAGARNLTVTSDRIEQLIAEARAQRKKCICFVTGVPGAGKTLVGLNIATAHRQTDEPAHAVFLSGNDPLVAVLREALIRDEAARLKVKKGAIRKGELGQTIKAFIQNVHHFRDACLVDERPPYEHVAIFDEAQRAWDLKQTASFMARKKNRKGFSQSEPAFLISCMDRHQDWAVVICLVGGGQEINRGEAGIDTWLEALESSFQNWDIYISPHLTDTEYAAGHAIEKVRRASRCHFDEALHLASSMRSFRTEKVSHFVKAVLDGEIDSATALHAQVASRYPIAITRDLRRAKDWIRSKARGSERYGLLASSGALRLKPHAIDVRVSSNPVHWFLNGKTDTRSSYYLEDAATEFQVQGLEVDWACVTWDSDLRRESAGWTYHNFRGTKWTNVGVRENQLYLKNAYRVLLTRARQGMVIFVPEGDEEDPTRSPKFYDPTYEYLSSLGIPSI